MAIQKRGDTTVQLNSKIPLPRERYTIQCVKESFGPSSSGNLMITREWQIVSPETVMANGQNVVVAGTKLSQYLVTKNMTDAKKSQDSLGRLFDDYNALGFPADEIDDENPTLHCEGVFADAILGSDESVARKDPTPEQRSRREQGDPILDSNGKEIKTYRPKIAQILGRVNM